MNEPTPEVYGCSQHGWQGEVPCPYCHKPEPEYHIPPELLKALKAYILGASAEAMGAAFDYEKLWSAVIAANERKAT